MFDDENEKRITTSISVKPSVNQKLKLKAFEKGFRSRNHLIEHIFDEFLKKEDKRQFRK